MTKIRIKKSLLLIFLTALIFSIIFLEIAVRILLPVPVHDLFTGSTKSWQISGRDINSFFNKKHFKFSSDLGYELVPDSDIGANSFGMIDKQRSQQKPERGYRIICLGDSTIAGGQSFDRVYPVSLEELLNKTGSEIQFEVWNCGVPGYGTIQMSKALQLKWLDYDPDLVVMGFCLNDFSVTPVVVREGNNLVGYFPNREIKKKINPFLLKHSALYRLFKAVTMSLNRSYKQDDVVKASTQSLKKAGNILKQRRIPFVVVILGLTENLSEYPPYFKRQYEIVKNMLEEIGVDYIDMVPVFEDNDPQSLVLVPGDKIHFNEKGGKIIARQLYLFLKARYIQDI